MPQSLTLRSSLDAWTSPDRPSARFGDTKLYAHSAAVSFEFFNKPRMLPGTIIISAVLRIFPDPSTGGSGTVDVSLHPLTSAFDPQVLTWSNQPTVGPVIQTVTRSSWFASGAPIEFTLTSQMQTAIDGGEWYGFRISSTEVDATQSFGGSQSTRPPELVITYTTPPQPPQNLRPSDNAPVADPKPTLSWNTPGGMQATQTHIQIQSATNAAFTTGVYVSDQIKSGASSIDLDVITPAFPAMTNGQSRYWMVRIKNDYGAWSDWSTTAQFTYVDPQVVNITSPGATTTDPSPTVTWTYSGVQAAWQITVEQRRPLAPIGNSLVGYVWDVVYDSGYQYTTQTSFDLPNGVVVYDDKLYRVRIRVWNAGEQVTLSGVPMYSEDVQEFDWTPSGATPPVDMELVDIRPGRPGKYLRWRYTGPTPSYFLVVMSRNGKDEYFTYSAATSREGTSEWYRAEFWLAGRTDLVFGISTVMANGTSSPWSESPNVYTRLNHKMPWIVSVHDPYNKNFCLVNSTIDPGLSEISDLVQPLGGQPFLASFAFNKFNGSASGELANGVISGLSAYEMKESMLWIRENPEVFFSWADQAIQAYIYNVGFVPISNADGTTDYAVSFNFVEV